MGSDFIKMHNKRLKTIAKIVICLITVIIVIGGLMLIYRQVARNKILKVNKITTENGIDEEFVAEINGINQYFYARGQNKKNPIILFIHGGPGSPVTPMIYTYQKGLESEYTVVNWDQRNAGKTYFLNKDKADEVTASLSVEQSVNDILGAVNLLKDKYNNEIIIMGHSWGSTIGTIFASRYPNMIKAYVGIGQNVSINDGEKLIAEETMKVISEKDKDKYSELVKDENNINLGSENFNAKKFSEHRKISGSYLMKDTMGDMEFVKTTLLSPYYSLSDIRWFLMDNLKLQKSLLKELGTIDLRKNYTEFKVPMIYIAGDKDWITPYPLVEEYYNQINAPQKELIFIKNAGHTPMMDNSKAFCDEVIRSLKTLSVEN